METTINELFANAVIRYTNQPALLEPSDKNDMVCLTYEMLQEQAQNFCGYLQQQHVQKGDRLLLWAESSIHWMITYLGAILTGAVIVPLDVKSRPDFVAKIAAVTDARYLISTQKQSATVSSSTLTFIDIDALPSGTFDAAQLPPVHGDDLAELVFTSGTTGQPKGVMLSHNNIASNALAAVSVVNIHSDDRALSILPLSHMFEMTIEIAIFSTGASVVYARTLNANTLLKLLASQHVTCMVLVPQALQLFMHGIESEVRNQKREKQWEMLQRVAPHIPFGLRRLLFNQVHKRFGGHFRFFVSGGAYLPAKLAERWENMGFRVMQGYGATECSPVVSVTPSNEHNYNSIGKPLPGEEVRIEDDELLVHGPNVSLGYWKNPEATAAAFQGGWYHTGDLGYKDEKGNLYLKGRKKNLIVLANGLNIYPEDIENALLANPLVKDAIVVGLMEEDTGPIVHAILLLNEPDKAKAVIAQ
ncbi:MAG TPA: AMP-binding protein, partial [Ktedonobacteraceae bacterium]|nr:AMP-binding protein [Ktedonobacteraceae bacterium]